MKDKDELEFDEERMDVIGRNGNDGLAYSVGDYEMSRVQTLKDGYRHDMIDEIEEEGEGNRD